MLSVPSTANLTLLESLVAPAPGTPAPGPLNGAKVHLFSNNYTPSINSNLAAFTEANFTGYAASSAITWGTPINNPDGSAGVIGDAKQFVATDGVVTQDIYGYYVTDGTGATLLFAEAFSVPVSIAKAGDGCVVVPYFGSVSQA